FTGGCNFKCPFCHNPELVFLPADLPPIEWKTIFDYLKKRKNMLGGVCITGGEPLLHDDIESIITQIKNLGLKVKIDTNGSNPELLKRLKVDYIAMDIKTSFEKYNQVGYTGNENLVDLIKESIEYVINSQIKYEFRTTVVPGLVDIEDIIKISELIKGSKKYTLAQFRQKNLLDPSWENITPYEEKVLKDMKRAAEERKINCEIRVY
ncbi:MAG TPA: anaerobic ribonucleoside-triphosphate reductase activating protein, partial [Spirochaetota bacterium]|nr:anaerobic ribonucleoside-triphosphate reductase activating protein [Spirochaetota bacterium]